MKSNKRIDRSNYDLTFYEKVGKILCFSETRYSEELNDLLDSKLKLILTSSEILKLRARLNLVTYEDIVNKEYIFRLNHETRKILKKLNHNDTLMQILKVHKNTTS